MNTARHIHIPLRYWGYLALLLWGGATLFLLRQDPYALDEGAAKSLLLVWSVADQIASSVVTFGAPDLRILLYIPPGFLWTGNAFAAKVLTVLALAFTARLLYAWMRQKLDSENALIATSLLVISPLTLTQIDTLSPGVYLLLAFSLGAWLDKAYRATPRPFGGWYFAQMFISAFSTSLHPAGLAYPLALLWSWHKEPLDHKQQRYFFVGIGFATLTTLLIRMGWNDLTWLQNPVNSLATIILEAGLNNEMMTAHWIAGCCVLIALTIVIIKQHRALWSDLTGRTMLIGLALGATSGDAAWAMIALSIILYFGSPLVLRPQQSSGGGLLRQRGIALLAIILTSTMFMRADKMHYQIRQQGLLSDQDQLIRSIAEEAENNRKAAEESDGAAPTARLRVASQWPGRTMIACRCDTLPLPPAAKDPQAQLTMLHSITHLLFNPQQTSNIGLSRNLAALGGGVTETVTLQPGGAVLHFKDTGTGNTRK